MNTTHKSAIEWNAAPVREHMDDLYAAECGSTNWSTLTAAGTFRVTCLISAMRSELGPNHNKARHAALGAKLAEAQEAMPLHFEEVTGSWEGVEEKSYMVVFDMPRREDGAAKASVDFRCTMYALAREYQQDALLLQYGDKAPAAVWQSAGPEFIRLGGHLTCVSPLEAHKQQGWTRKADGSYWIVKA